MAYIDNVTNILQIQPDGLPTFVRLSQNENGRNLYFQLAGNEIDIPSNATVTISGTKPDGNVYSGTGSVTDNVVLIPEMLQMTAVAGTWDAKVKITSGGNTIATGRVRFIVDADAVAPGSVPSSSELEGLVAEAQQYAETARTEAYGSPLTAQTAAGMTDHTRVYVYTGSETGYTAGHWYFWNGSAWTDGGIYNSVAVNTDTTLTLSGVAADAKATGDAIEAARVAIDDTLSNTGEAADAKVVGDELTDLKSDLTQIEEEIADIEPGLSDDAKVALLNCFQHVAWIDGYGQTYYNALESALYADQYPRITAQFNSGLNVIYTDDTLDSLKQYLTVKYYETEESTGTVIASANYSLSGSLAEGESTIFVSYSGLTTSFIINGVVDFYNIWEWSLENGMLEIIDKSSLDRNANVTSRISIRTDSATANRKVESPTQAKGYVPYYTYSGNQRTDYYPIPIPKEAEKVTVSITPNTQYVYAQACYFEDGVYKWDAWLKTSGWQQGSAVLTFGDDKPEKAVLLWGMKYDSAGASYPTAPTNVSAVFE